MVSMPQFRLTGMTEAFADQIKQPDIDRLSFAERFGLIVDRLWTWKENNRVVGKALRLEPGRAPLGDAVVVGAAPEARESQARLPWNQGKLLIAPEFRLQDPGSGHLRYLTITT
jgi:hypothetical protein